MDGCVGVELRLVLVELLLELVAAWNLEDEEEEE